MSVIVELLVELLLGLRRPGWLLKVAPAMCFIGRGAAPEGNGGSSGPMEESLMGRSTSAQVLPYSVSAIALAASTSVASG